MSRRKLMDLLPDLFGRRRIFELECELEEAQGQVEEMQAEMGVISNDFEKDCWRSLRRLIDLCGYDWRGVESDGVTALEAEEFVETTLKDITHRLDQHSTALINSQFLIVDLQNALRIFVRHYEPWMDHHADDMQVSTFARHTFGELRKAKALLPEVLAEAKAKAGAA